MRKLPATLVVTTILSSLGAFAAIPTDATPFQLVVPNLRSGFDITLEGLLLQPTNNDLDYATSSTTSVFGQGGDRTAAFDFDTNARVRSVSPRYHLGFRVGLGYTFADSGNDVQLSWTHFRHTDTERFTPDPGTMFTTRNGILFIMGEFDLPDDFDVERITGASGASTTVQTRMDAIDLDAGQYVDFGTRLRMRLFAGLRYADVRSNMSNGYGQEIEFFNPGLVADAFYTLNEQFNSRFRGVGPRFGVDSVYHIGHCFGVVSRMAVGVLAGRTDSNSSVAVNAIAHTFPNDEGDPTILLDADGNLSSRSFAGVVPVLDGRLGLNYTWSFENQSMLTLEGGYQATQYINAVDRLNTTFGVVPGADDNVSFVPVASQRVTSGLGFNGPYLNLNWKI